MTNIRYPLKFCEVIYRGELITFPDYAVLNGKEIVRLTKANHTQPGKILKKVIRSNDCKKI